MKKAFISLFLLTAGVFASSAENLVILTTNDTHSNIDFDNNGRGGILPRKAIIDSVRKAEKNVILVDAGDMVQGTLYFKYFKGDVEYPIFNMMDYDIRILGNHEFDNGLEELAKYWKDVKATCLSANYDFSKTPARGLFKPYVIKKVGKKKIGFFGINVDPESLISKENYEGMKYYDAIETANKTAAMLRDKEKCDLVVAVTHIGYEAIPGKASDMEMARRSKDIDIIIGGHSHTFVDPATPEATPYWINNAVGKPVLVTQTGKYGRNVGYINIDLDDIKDRKFDYEYIPVTDRFSPDAYDKNIERFLAPFKHAVDSVNSNIVAWSLQDMSNSGRTGAYPNWTADFGLDFGRHIADSIRSAKGDFPQIDLSIMNVGGIRQPMKKGAVTEGQILSTFPFSNHMTIIEIKGKDIIDALKIATAKGGEAVSANIRVVTDGKGNLQKVIIDGEEMNPEKMYTLATIDYVANGNDDLVSMANNRMLWQSKHEMCVYVLGYLKHLTELGIPVSSDPESRFVENGKIEIDRFLSEKNQP